jgi:hypothetical protein
MEHVSDHDLERYYLGMVVTEPELSRAYSGEGERHSGGKVNGIPG